MTDQGKRGGWEQLCLCPLCRDVYEWTPSSYPQDTFVGYRVDPSHVRLGVDLLDLADIVTAGKVLRLRDGAIVWALARLNGASDTKIGRGEGKADEVRGYMLLATAHDGSIATTGIPTQTRVVCWNTLRAALDIGAFGKQGKKQPTEFRMIHTAKFDEAKWQEARQTMGMAIEQIAQVNEVANELAKVKIDAEGRLQFVEKLLLSKGDLLETVISDQRPSGSALDAAISQTQGLTKEAREKRIGFVGRAILEAMLNSPGADFASSKDTMWGALNGVTFYADHASKTFSESNRMYNSWFGKNDNLKSDALNLAIEMSGIRVGQA